MFRSVLLPIVVGGTLMVWDGAHRHGPTAASNEPAAKAFQRLKSLAGEWEIVKGNDAGTGKTAVSYRVTAGGSAVIELIFPGSDMEMVSVYHRDGKDLLMTHYCMVGNQPRMRLRAADDENRLVFEFAGGTNLDPAKDAHIHGGSIQLVDSDHIRSEWEYYSGGKAVEKHAFDLARKR